MKRRVLFIFCAVAALALLPAASFAAPSHCADIATSAGPAPPELAAECGGKLPDSYPQFNPSDLAASPDGVLTTCSTMTLNNPGAPVDTGLLDFRPACDFAGDDFTKLYCFTFDVPGVLSTVDISTCTETVIGTGSNTQSASGMAWDNSNGTMYLSTTNIATSELHTVNLGTGATTLVGGMGAASPGAIAIAVMDGQMYSFDVTSDSLHSINKSTGAATTIGPLGFDANFAQGMDFDESDGTCYIFAFNNTVFNAELRTCDVNTGATALVGGIGGGELREWTGAGVLAGGGGGGPDYLLCDNFNKTWEVNLDLCPEAANGLCITGVRQSGFAPCGLTGIGDVPIFGAFSNGVVQMTSMDDPLDDPLGACQAVTWTCNVGGGCTGGVWHNESLSTGTFSLTPGACVGPTSGYDPSRGE